MATKNGPSKLQHPTGTAEKLSSGHGAGGNSKVEQDGPDCEDAAVIVALVPSSMTRHLRERDTARTSGDKLARAVLDHHQAEPYADLAAALVEFHSSDGPAWALPPGEFMVTRYDWRQHRTVVVAVFGDRAAADAELDRLLNREKADRASGKIARPNHYEIRRRG